MSEESIGSIAGSGGGGCFQKGTLIQQENGKSIAIEKLKVGDKVLSFDEFGKIHLSKVTQIHHHEKPEPLIRVKFWRGEIVITPNHWVLNQYGAFTEMGALTTHDALVDGMGHLRPIMGAEPIGLESVYNLTVEPNHTFIANGIRVHNGGYRERFPTVAGSGGGGGSKGGAGSRAAIEDPDSLQSKAMISILDLIGEGQIGGLVDGARSIYFDNTPIQNADGTWNFSVQSAPDANGVSTSTPVAFSYEFRDGQQSQVPVAGYSDVETPHIVGLTAKNPGTSQPITVTITNTNADAVRLIVATPSLISQDTTTGDVHGSSVDFKFMIAVNDGAYQNLSGTLTISGKTRSRYQRSYQYNLPKTALNGAVAQKWNIAMHRITPDETTSNVNNTIQFDSYVEIVNSRLSYPNSALVGITIDSSQFSQIPQRSYLVRGLYIKIPSNYNPTTRAYSGVWDGTFTIAVSNNPAWVMYDLMTNPRYGLGQYISASQVDKAKLYQIGKYCDEMVPDGFGGTEPRFTINTVIQTQAEAFKLLSDLSSVFRGMTYWNGGMACFTQDSPTDPTMAFSPANVVDGLFNYAGSARKDRHSVVLVTWNDPAQYYKQVIEYVENQELVAKFGIRKLEVVAFGCTSRGQANRVGKWILYTEAYEANLVSFRVGIDSALCLPGEVVKIHDPARAGKRLGGRLVSCTTTSAILDAEVSLTDGTTATISIRLQDGTFVERPLLQFGQNTNTVSWTVPLPTTPVANAIWLISEDNLVPMLARIVGIGQADAPNEFNITAIEHNPSKYAAIENNLKLETPNTSIIDTSKVSAPANLTIGESQYEVAPGLVGLKIDLSWTGDAQYYEITWRRFGAYQTNAATVTTSSPFFEIENARPGLYSFTLIAVNTFGVRSQATYTNYTPVGKMNLPGDVANFKATKRVHDILLTWNEVMDIGAVTYEVREGLSWDSGTVLSTRMAGTTLTDYKHSAGTYSYHIRSINSAGEYSATVSTSEITLLAPVNVSNFNCVPSNGRIEFRWDANPEPNINSYEIREGASWNTGVLLCQVNATSYTIPAGGVGSRTFWIKAIASPDIYSIDAVFSTTSIAASSNTNLIWSTDQTTLSYPGHRNKLTVNGGLAMSVGAKRSEYIFPADLGSQYTAQNIIYGSIDSIVAGTLTWAGSNFSWDSANANQAWVVSGSISSVSGRYQIAKYTGTQGVNDYDGWRLNGSLSSIGGIAANQAVSATYQAGRYDSQGLLVGDMTAVDWNVSIPQAFNVTFWIIPKTVADASYWGVTGAGGIFMKLKYSLSDLAFHLIDNVGHDLVVPYSFAIDDNLCVGISQSSTVRRLMIGRMGDSDSAIAELTTTPLGAFTKMALY